MAVPRSAAVYVEDPTVKDLAMREFSSPESIEAARGWVQHERRRLDQHAQLERQQLDQYEQLERQRLELELQRLGKSVQLERQRLEQSAQLERQRLDLIGLNLDRQLAVLSPPTRTSAGADDGRGHGVEP